MFTPHTAILKAAKTNRVKARSYIRRAHAQRFRVGPCKKLKDAAAKELTKLVYYYEAAASSSKNATLDGRCKDIRKWLAKYHESQTLSSLDKAMEFVDLSHQRFRSVMLP